MNKAQRFAYVLILVLAFAYSTVDAAKWKRGPDGKLIPATESQAPESTNPAPANVNQADIARTRKQIQMLDDLYKSAVVLITEHYVNDPSILSAATASKALFAAMKAKGWHEARLLGFTDVLFNPSENAPRDDFEKKAKIKILAGDPSYEEVQSMNGRNYLRMATTVPVVMEKCIMCHANFKGIEGAIGAISYKVPLIK